MPLRRSLRPALIGLALVAVGALAGQQDDRATANATNWGPRDPWYRPYAASSIWNTPIGSGAVYVPSGYPVMTANAVDPVHLVRAAASDPVRQVREPYRWLDRCNPAARPTGLSIRLPDGFVIGDARRLPDGTWVTPNNAGVVLDPDGRTVRSFTLMCRDSRGGPLYANHRGESATTDLYGDGRLGLHGASRMSILGGAIRPGELTSGRPIAHALDLVLYTKYAAITADGCFRWPAAGCDGYASPGHPDNDGRYRGTVPDLQIGSLLALPPEVTYADLGVTTPVGRLLFDAMQDFGGYWTEDSASERNYLVIDSSATADIDAFARPATKAEFGRIIAAARVVANNGPDTIGGGGTPRAPVHVDEFDTGVAEVRSTATRLGAGR